MCSWLGHNPTVLLFCFGLCSVPVAGGCTRKTVVPDPDVPGADDDGADPPVEDKDDESATSKYVARSRSRPSPGVKGVYHLAGIQGGP
jgi:hypothetical protein